MHKHRPLHPVLVAVPLVAMPLLALSACSKTEVGDQSSTSGGNDGAGADAGLGTEDGSTLFDTSRVATVALEVTEADLAILRADADLPMGSEDFTYVSARLTYDSVVLENVGLRVKGNSSRASVQGDAVPFKIDTNRFVEKQKLDGQTKLNLHNSVNQPAKMSEYLSYTAFREFGVPASRTGWIDLTLNGQSLGVYTLVEQVGKALLSGYYEDGSADLYKPEPPAGYLTYSGDSFDAYEGADYEADNDSDHATFLRLVTTLESSPVNAWNEAIDLNSVLDYFAGNVALGNWDTYVTMGHNYYLFEATPGQMVMLPWDMNLSQGATTAVCPAELMIGGGGAIVPGGALPEGMLPNMELPLEFDGGIPPDFGEVPADFEGVPPNFAGAAAPGGGARNVPLHDKLLADPTQLARYFERLAAFLNGPGSVAALDAHIDVARATLGDHVVDADVEQLRNAIAQRVAALTAALETTTSCTTASTL